MTNGPRYKTCMHENYTHYNFSPEQQRSPYSKLDIPVKNNTHNELCNSVPILILIGSRRTAYSN